MAMDSEKQLRQSVNSYHFDSKNWAVTISLPYMPQSPSPISANLYAQPFSMSRAQREQLHGHGVRVLWLAGPSDARKSTLTKVLDACLACPGEAYLSANNCIGADAKALPNGWSYEHSFTWR